ncbi:MAG: ribose 5-phosphate isomerase B [Chloroflexi bacterium RBG_13_48_10]|nr:MAG: ribose 5-phosphate isomerase B [Chloroflexi bacterium RBG_13_48_10]
MQIALATDHGGFPLKNIVKDCIESSGHSVIDLGTDSTESVDYPDLAEKLGMAITTGQAERGVLICGSGVGASIAANKIKGIYAAVCHDAYTAHQGVEHDNMNVLCLGARVVGPNLALELVSAFLAARFSSEERHVRRVNKIYQIEKRGL